MAALKTMMACGAALALLSIGALAQNKPSVEPNKLTVESKRPPLQLNDKQRAALEQGLVSENTQQKTPPKFAAKVGTPIPASIKVDVMPAKLLQQEPSLEPYGYAKLAKELLVIDPMKKTIVAVIPRLQPASGKDLKPADWAATRGRELTGQAPQPAAAGQAPEPAGDGGDVKNGTEQTPKEK
ncbi:MAG TPA: hypothetical protein VMG39_11455 [Pseudolabrys sp.]|nr:hypothetical protein [Pseudolabrys sp.]